MVSLISQLVSFSTAAAVLLKLQGTLYTKSIYVFITLQKNPFMYSFSNFAASDPISSFHIHVSVSDFYIPRIGPHISWCRIGRSMVGIYKSLTETWLRELGLWPRNSFSGNICFEFSLLVLCSVYLNNLRCWRRSPCVFVFFVLKKCRGAKVCREISFLPLRYPKLLTENSGLCDICTEKGRKLKEFLQSERVNYGFSDYRMECFVSKLRILINSARNATCRSYFGSISWFCCRERCSESKIWK